MSLTLIARRFASTPARPAFDTWSAIAMLISSSGTEARQELERIAGVASSLIADQAPESSPIVVWGTGPRLRIYCVYGDAAVLGEGINEAPLSWTPTSGDWAMSLPCPKEDLEWARQAIAKNSAHASVRDVDEPAPGGDEEPKASDSPHRIDKESFLRP